MCELGLGRAAKTLSSVTVRSFEFAVVMVLKVVWKRWSESH